MNSNNYQLGTNNPELNDKADYLVRNITFLANERVYHKRFPVFSTIEYSDIDEEELIMHIEDLEKIYNKARKETTFGMLHQQAHPYLLQKEGDYYPIYHNTRCGTDTLDDAPIAGGSTPFQALCNAWKAWSIPSVLILNAEYYCPGVGINEVVE